MRRLGSRLFFGGYFFTGNRIESLGWVRGSIGSFPSLSRLGGGRFFPGGGLPGIGFGRWLGCGCFGWLAGLGGLGAGLGFLRIFSGRRSRRRGEGFCKRVSLRRFIK